MLESCFNKMMKEGMPMGRLRKLFIFLVCCLLLTTTVFAESTASRVDNITTVGIDGTCQVMLTVVVKLDSPAKNLTFPLPQNARNVTLSGASVRTSKNGDIIEADLSQLDGLIGEYPLTFSYTLQNAVSRVDDEKTGTKKLMLTVPLLSGFSYPVDTLSFSITLPDDAVYAPSFYSSYLQQSVESNLKSVNTGKTITGYTTAQLNDHETLYMSMEVTQEMFRGLSFFSREGNPELIPMVLCAVLALVYWLATLRTGPILRQHRVVPLEGVTAGEMGCRLTAAGGDLTMMVFTWASLGYIQIYVDKRGRVQLYKRMDMGNERGPYENRCFQALFGKRAVVDATGEAYARLFRKAGQIVPGIQEMYRKGAGNVKIFRWLCCGTGLFSGICFAMNFATNTVVQILLAIVLAALGALLSWNIQSGMYRLHLRGKLPLLLAGVASALWLLLGLLAGQPLMALLAVGVQLLGGLLAAYGGRRSDLGHYSACQVLGLRYYMSHIAKPELQRICEYNPEYFFEMVPYAMALGVDAAFSKQFGNMPLPPCPYLTVQKKTRGTAGDWAALLRQTADAMDRRQRKMQLEKWIPFTLRK